MSNINKIREYWKGFITQSGSRCVYMIKRVFIHNNKEMKIKNPTKVYKKNNFDIERFFERNS